MSPFIALHPQNPHKHNANQISHLNPGAFSSNMNLNVFEQIDSLRTTYVRSCGSYSLENTTWKHVGLFPKTTDFGMSLGAIPYNKLLGLQRDPMIDIYIDHNVWDYLFKHEINLCDIFPKESFNICITKHGRYEIDQLPNNSEKNQLRSFIESTMIHDVSQHDIFGFYEPIHPDNEQRSSGFGEGGFTSSQANKMKELLDKLYPEKPKRKPSLILTPNEADKELGVISVHAHVLTLDSKAGPLRTAKENNGKVIYIKDFHVNCTPAEALEKIAKSIMKI